MSIGVKIALGATGVVALATIIQYFRLQSQISTFQANAADGYVVSPTVLSNFPFSVKVSAANNIATVGSVSFIATAS